MENRRQHIRFMFNGPVEFQRSQGAGLVGSVAEDISQSGLKISANEFIPKNTILNLQIHLPGQMQIVPASARVMWVRESAYRMDGWELGLELIQSQEVAQGIGKFINQRRFESM